ncbi:arabinose efflux permease family protein [Aciduliprofundum sp. MAR08-339]|uniref:MFS transporter n=1 Tax=Aciduliprofundum sp. (strain MAR08-339) TaxID=673860 RepID=UPI0002A4BB28|nr:arabinose efflux permease family protein [Aciduliprofundum sp. MAR08-339]
MDKRIYAIQVATYTALMLSITYTPSLAARAGGSAFEIALIFSLYNLAYFLSSMIFGRLADLHGRKIFISAGFLVASLAFVSQYFYWNYYSLLILRVMAGFSAGIFPAATISLAHDMRIKMGKLSAFGAAGWALGSYLAGIVSLFFGLKATYVFSSIVFIIAYFITLGLKDLGVRVENVPRIPLEVIRRNWHVYLSYIFRHSAATMIWAFWPLFVASIGGNSFWQAATMGVNSTAQFFIMYFYADTKKSTHLILWGLALSSLTFLLYALITNVWEMLPVQVILATSWAFLYVGSLNYLTSRNPEKATATGLLNSSIGISAFIGPLLGGAFMSFVANYRYLMLFSATVSLFGVIIFKIGERG